MRERESQKERKNRNTNWNTINSIYVHAIVHDLGTEIQLVADYRIVIFGDRKRITPFIISITKRRSDVDIGWKLKTSFEGKLSFKKVLFVKLLQS
jgi:hypothetical protein